MFFLVNDLSVGYNGKAVVSGINISLEKGEILSVIGQNGSGKSTFLKTVSCSIKRISGGIVINDKELEKISLQERSRLMSLLLTDRIKPEYMTGRDIIESGRFPYTGKLGILSDNDREVVRSIIEITGTETLADKLFSIMSDGEKQRILFARALSQEPEILIMDEPMSYLDIKYKIEIIDILKKLCRDKGLTVIMSMHEAFMAAKVSDKLLCFKDNKVFASGAPDEIFKEEMVKELYDIDDRGISFIMSN